MENEEWIEIERNWRKALNQKMDKEMKSED